MPLILPRLVDYPKFKVPEGERQWSKWPEWSVEWSREYGDEGKSCGCGHIEVSCQDVGRIKAHHGSLEINNGINKEVNNGIILAHGPFSWSVAHSAKVRIR